MDPMSHSRPARVTVVHTPGCHAGNWPHSWHDGPRSRDGQRPARIGGILAAFLAGGVALFAPCCIVFLAPSYLAVAVKNRR